ncbi:uncharacterized protein [Brachionichthys hirsutus]|uniref:uncharacterized protein n=1 Tax=Brachionichthys hirsutus TaxID=412623 RepID=UPI003604AB22
MQSQGRTSAPPSFDSLSSSDGLFFSDSEQAEDDADVFLMDSSSSVIIVGADRAVAPGDAGSASPGSQWTYDSFNDKEEESSCGSESSRNAALVRLDETDPASPAPKSEGDRLFAQKCAELQGFVRPMLELLNGLKRGRFDRGLSGFQQSVAMDRIQRIVGVLQRPNSGEKYLNTLLQVEGMLKLWFPHISPQSVSAASSVASSPAHSVPDTSCSTPPHKHRDQLHIPVKKRRLSWTGSDSPAPSPAGLKCPRVSAEEKRAKRGGDGSDGPSPSVGSDANQNSPNKAADIQMNADVKGRKREDLTKLSKYKAGQRSEPSLTWVHVAPILSPGKACRSHEGTTMARPPGRQGSPATQDSAISSTTPYKQHKTPKKPSWCRSQLVPGKRRETVEACRDQNQSSVTLQPLPRVCPPPPAPLET